MLTRRIIPNYGHNRRGFPAPTHYAQSPNKARWMPLRRPATRRPPKVRGGSSNAPAPTIRARSGFWCGVRSPTWPRRCTTPPTSNRNCASISSARGTGASDQAARDYVVQQHPDLWLIEAETTFRGMYVGGKQDGDLGNREFIARHVKGHGALGDLLAAKKADIKMGDTPSVLYLLRGDAENPAGESWGGAFVRPDPRVPTGRTIPIRHCAKGISPGQNREPLARELSARLATAHGVAANPPDPQRRLRATQT
jgi:hypothetical protein